MEIIDAINNKVTFFSKFFVQYETLFSLSMFKFSHFKINYEVQLWDCGSEILTYNKHIRSAFFKNCSAGLLMFDLSNEKWKAHIDEWLE